MSQRSVRYEGNKKKKKRACGCWQGKIAEGENLAQWEEIGVSIDVVC